MKSKVGLLVVVFVLSFLCNSHAQNSSFSFEQENAHVLYGSDFKNPLKISGTSNFDSLTIEYDYYDPIFAEDEFEQIVISDSTLMNGIGIITKGSSENSYTVQVGRGVNAKLNFYLDGKIIESRTYKIIDLPRPIVKFGKVGSSDALITLEELRNVKSLTCEKIDWEYDEKYEVEGFRLSIIGPEKIIERESGEGAQFTQEILDALSKVRVGDKLIISNIRVSFDGTRTPSNSICVKITD